MSVGSKHVCVCIYVGSVGKSTLLTMLTGTQSEAAAYEFTTLTCIPGIINYNDAKIQLLDLPGIIEGASEGKGRGRQVGNTVTKSLILENMFFQIIKYLELLQICLPSYHIANFLCCKLVVSATGCLQWIISSEMFMSLIDHNP
jgi:hypothetical protein